jgi:hypothetical protein
MTYLRDVANPSEIITAIDASIRFPEILGACQEKYDGNIRQFKELIATVKNCLAGFAQIPLVATSEWRS